MTRNNPLRRSGTRLEKQGKLWLQQTWNAGEIFAAESQAATLTFARDMKTASAKLVTTASRSTDAFRNALHKEALDWQKLVIQTRDAYGAAISERLQRIQHQALSTRESLKPEAVETTILESAKDLLDRAQGRVGQRLEQAAKPAAVAKVAAAKPASKAKATKARTKKGAAPLRNYDQLPARDLVSRVQRLSGPQATAVLEYERSRKKRATVIRAAEQRLSAAS
jgi:hypothetical protein